MRNQEACWSGEAPERTQGTTRARHVPPAALPQHMGTAVVLAIGHTVCVALRAGHAKLHPPLLVLLRGGSLLRRAPLLGAACKLVWVWHGMRVVMKTVSSTSS